MFRFLKWLVLVILGIVAFLLLLVVLLGVGLFGAAKDMVKAGETAVTVAALETEKQITITPEGATINAGLVPTRAVVLDGVRLCEHTGLPAGLDYSSSTFNGTSKTLLSYDQSVDGSLPKDLTIRRQAADGRCVSQTIPQIRDYIRTVGYKSEIGLSRQMMQKIGMQVPPEEPGKGVSFSYNGGTTSQEGKRVGVERLSGSQYTSVSSLTMNATTRLQFSYTTRPTGDEFSYAGKIVRLQFPAAQ